MALTLHILNASQNLEKFESKISSVLNETYSQVSLRVSLPDVDVVIDDDAFSAITETGVGGYSPSAHIVYIHVDTNNASLHTTLENELKSTLTHELHHCARWASVGYGTTLLEAVVSEGLADHFDIEINGGVPKPWSTNLTGKELEEALNVARSEFSNTDYNHTFWFFGSDTIKRWSGYSLGFKLVGDYMEKTGKKASELVDTPAKLFLE